MKTMFDGIRVVDFSNGLAGPHSTSFLADFGAEVIKIERPKVGDEMRGYLPLLDGTGIPFLFTNRSKKSVVLELSDPEGIEAAKKIIATSDILLETYRPGVMKKFGLSYEEVKEINPRIIYCSLSAYGQEGKFSKKPGYDLLAQAISGVMDMTGDADGQPTRSGFVLADNCSGVYAYGAMVTALYNREKTGEGQHLDISLIDTLVSFNHYVEGVNIGAQPTRNGNNSPAACPFGIFNCGKGVYVALCAHGQKHWAILCKTLGREDMISDPKYINATARTANQVEVIKVIEDWFQSFENLDEALKILDDAGISCEKIRKTSEMLTDEYLLDRGMIVDLDLPKGYSLKTMKAKGSPMRFSGYKAVYKAPPLLGEHEEDILAPLGYDAADIARMKEKWDIK